MILLRILSQYVVNLDQCYSICVPYTDVSVRTVTIGKLETSRNRNHPILLHQEIMLPITPLQNRSVKLTRVVVFTARLDLQSTSNFLSLRDQ